MIDNRTPLGGYAIQTPTFFEKSLVRSTGNHVGFIVLMFFVVNLLWQFGYMAIMMLLGYSSEQTLAPLRDTVVLIATNILITTLIFVGGGFACSKMERIPIRKLISLRLPKKGLFVPALLMGIGFCSVANIATSLLSSILSTLFHFDLKGQDIAMPTNIYGAFVMVIGIAAFPAMLEEFAMRGVIMGSLMRFGKSFAILSSAMIFGLLHGNLVQIPFAFLVGLVLAYVAFETGSLWTGILIHFFNNLLSVVMEYAAKVLSDKSINLIYMLLTILMISVGLFGFYLMTHRKEATFTFEKTPHISTTKQRMKWLFTAPIMIFFFITVVIEIVLAQIGSLG